jgi:hypothetical protein
MYDLDGGKMIQVVETLEQYSYHGTDLKELLAKIRKQIEKEDFMEAGDSLAALRKKAKEGR